MGSQEESRPRPDVMGLIPGGLAMAQGEESFRQGYQIIYFPNWDTFKNESGHH